MLTKPWAVPRVALGLNVRAKSKPTIEPGPPTEITRISTRSSHSGARSGRANTTVQASALLAMIANTIRERRFGYRPVTMPITMPEEMAATTDAVSRAPVTPVDRPWATVRYGTPHIRAKTVTENWVPMWVKNPNRVPGRSHTAFTLRSVARTDIVSLATDRPRGVSFTSASTSTIANVPRAATET